MREQYNEIFKLKNLLEKQKIPFYWREYIGGY